MELKGKKALVIGIAKSGMAVAKFLKNKGVEVTLSDIKEKGKLGQIVKELEAEGFSLILGRQPEVSREKFSFLIVSPGVPLTIEPIQQAKLKDIPIYSEVEIAFRFSNTPIVAITGTNGKTTTTSLIGEIFKNANYQTLVAGNIGLPIIEEVEKYAEKDIIVAEVSSFQLETTVDFRPKVSVVLNITPDHLDRHGTMEGYTEAKAKIFVNQKPTDYTVLNYDDARVSKLSKYTKAKVIFFSRQHILEEGVYVDAGQIWVRDESGKTSICGVNEVKIPGSHNLENALAAVAATSALQVENNTIAHTLKNFGGVSHRLEFVDEIKGVKFINDSKGTNPDASIKALESYEEPIILIAGGKNKGSDFKEIAEKIKEKVKELILIGESAPLIKKAATDVGFEKIHVAKEYPEAVKMAYDLASSGDIILLSPACASWDMFNSYEERGDLFKKVVKSLRG